MRLILKMLGLVLVIVIIGLVIVATNLGGMIKKGVETYAPPIMGTSVVLDSASVMPMSGAGSLKGLAIGQPEGFGEGSAIALAEASVGVDLMSLRGDTIVVEHIMIDGPELNYVQGIDGNNIQALLDNIKRNTGSTADESGPEPTPRPEDESDEGAEDSPRQPDQPAKKLIVDRLSISGVAMTASSPLLPGEKLALVLQPIELRDIGRDQGGVSAAQLMAEIARQLNAEVERAIADSEEFKSLLGGAAKRRAQEEAERALERELGTDNASKLKGLLDQF